MIILNLDPRKHALCKSLVKNSLMQKAIRFCIREFNARLSPPDSKHTLMRKDLKTFGKQNFPVSLCIFRFRMLLRKNPHLDLVCAMVVHLCDRNL